MGVIINRYLNDVTWQNAAATSPVINDSEVHVWRINISQNIKRLEKFEALLTADEKLRAGKYKQPKDTYRFIVSRGAQRIILGRYLNQPPAELQFVLGENKKPHLIGVDGNIVRYNLSHSGDWVVLAIATASIGADVEFIDAAFPFRDILEDNFSEYEAAYIGTSSEKFFTLWTRKEAILKATAQGLGEHLSITPALDGEYLLDALLTGSNKNWQLNSFLLHPGYIATVVVENAGQELQFFDADLF
ncbi:MULTISPECIES: 4'-phosphopantetheinyl transferase superfamily protein [unclassified Mucilaginibacter]|uniref:4'-phosphopantetheinyl transferase family protein n=1 Tax=unclassified Mucilaginibacter TaxID=2617802 RepID=UPI002AC94C76|nr:MULTISPECIES: 4'-phosphopantetheinyl transferase superfamily protein [unclassified Mucilaginibacter]MEB0262275.1 4'-phosphopantetheinyl transferase superfamily protein [Mucilaginibacter sp. 10I4]MEB0277101.1 4'-phosphopantetheinyl transferase superfamily protein [Mucilaginibacter sp. 10B2]MEB0301833.1 4'-phosphopantetheinyl transferase superfamily protein [Mucilaginibacter sp. 5C4]WPX25201.1 4'-phosphopantetheinyl transferase superfamily protein [Mucilaginibacter sp. 5C4]